MKVRRIVAAILACTLGTIAIAALCGRFIRQPAPEPVAAATIAHEPSLFCEFYDFMHRTVVASYDFGLDARIPDRLALRAQVWPDGSRTTFSGDERPAWTYAFEDETAAVTAPDGDTRILLYGLEPRAAGVFWTEAGVRSMVTRNLEGRCRQAYLARAVAWLLASAPHEKRSSR